jgi:hypothetical protein
VGTERGGDDVAAGRRLGTPWRVREGQQRGEQSRDWAGATHGRRVSRSWSGDGGKPTTRGRALR